MTATPRLPRVVTLYVTAWVAATLAATVPTALALGTSQVSLQRVAAMAVVVGLGGLTALRFRFSQRFLGAFTLIEAAVAATLLLLPGDEAVLAVGAGTLVANLLRRRSLHKVAFNTAQIATSTYATAMVLRALPSIGPAVGRHGIGTLGIAMAVFGVVNMVSLMGLLRLLSADVGAALRSQGWMSASALLGGMPIGILGAELSATRPVLVALLVAPAAAVFLAYRGVDRTQQLLGQARRDHERLDRIVAGTSDGILLLGADGTIEVWNAALTQLTGIPGPAAVGQPVDRMLAGVRLGDPVSDTWRLAEADPATPTLVDQAQLRHLIDGTIRTVRESHTFRFDGGTCVGDVVVITDVTREQEVADLKGDFVARVSHELRTPLTPIKGFASMLLKRADTMDSAQRQSALERIVERTDRLAELVDDLLLVTELDRTQSETPTAAPVATTVDAAAVVEELALTVRREQDREVDVEAVGDTTAIADADRVSQVLRHLLDNAVRYSPAGAPVTVRVARSADVLEVAVVDRGRGIPRSEHDRIFEPFLRLEDPLRMTTSGVGVGLYIARRLAREMHGDVHVASRPGSGSTFTLELPVPDRAPVEATVGTHPGGHPAKET